MVKKVKCNRIQYGCNKLAISPYLANKLTKGKYKFKIIYLCREHFRKVYGGG